MKKGARSSSGMCRGQTGQRAVSKSDKPEHDRTDQSSRAQSAHTKAAHDHTVVLSPVSVDRRGQRPHHPLQNFAKLTHFVLTLLCESY